MYIIDHIVFIVNLLSPHSDYLARQLYFACGDLSYNIAEVRRYLDEGVDPNHSYYSSRVLGGSTPLHWACQWNRPEAVKLLVERGANVEAIDRDGHTPLHTACSEGSVECVQPLLDHHCNLGECEYD